MQYKLFLEGQEITLAEEIAATDETLRNAIVSFFPEVGTAEIKREQKNETVEIRIVKRAGTKGNDAVEFLIDSTSAINPALALSWQLKQLEREGSLSTEYLISIQPNISQAITTGEDWQKDVAQTMANLQKCQPIPSSTQITGI